LRLIKRSFLIALKVLVEGLSISNADALWPIRTRHFCRFDEEGCLTKVTFLRSMKKSTFQSAFFSPRVLITLLLCAAGGSSIVSGTLLEFFYPEAPAKDAKRTLTLEERVAYQRVIEEVYWRHRIWPKANANPKPSLDAVISQAQLEKKVKDYLRNSQALEHYWQRPITSQQLQAEMDRMAKNTKQPEVLQELFEALGNDPFIIAECLARRVLSERLVMSSRRFDQTFNSIGRPPVAAASASYTVPVISGGPTGCIDDTWSATSTNNAADARAGHRAVWTGTEMIVWGGGAAANFNTGGRYSPSTDSWTVTSTTNAPTGRSAHTAIWTGSEMIVWGGYDGINSLNTGGKYNPGTDSWTATTATNAPAARNSHTAVWTGSEMIVWGGGAAVYFNTGGRYNPSTDSWTATSTTNAPNGRVDHTAVWTGNEMIVWGGFDGNSWLNTGGRYDSGVDSWIATSTSNAPAGRYQHTAVWTGSQMIVWGGFDGTSFSNTGGRYDSSADTWAATSIANAPTARYWHTAVGTGNKMIVWGGTDDDSVFNTGGRYDPSADIWTATSTTNAANARFGHTAVWTGSEMIVWGGVDMDGNLLNTGSSYCAQSGPTPTPSPTPTPTPCTGRCEPTPRPRPTPAPRP
jgi:N-acetylneuraminic acid mutarotase